MAGLAALVLSAHDFSAAQTKACIVAGAQDHGIAVDGHDFHVIYAPSAVEREGTIGPPPEVDLVFSLDLSGSMGGELNQLKLQIGRIAPYDDDESVILRPIRQTTASASVCRRLTASRLTTLRTGLRVARASV